MSIYAIIYILLTVVGLCLMAHRHGKPREPHNFWEFLAVIPVWILLYFGGFFNA